MRWIIAALLGLCCTAHAQELQSIDIVGPDEILAQSETQYTCIAHFDDGDVNVTLEADWSVEPSLIASIEDGLLILEGHERDVTVVVSASFSFGDQEATTATEVLVVPVIQIHDTLIPTDGAPDTYFGQSVAVSGDVAIVGAQDSQGSGAAYLFDLRSGQEMMTLLPEPYVAGDNFGDRVDVHGDVAAVGASFDDAVYLFDVSTGRQMHKLQPTGRFAYFGHSIAVSESTVIVGAYGDNENGTFSGAAYVFDIDSGLKLHKLSPEDGAEWDTFGISVGLSGDTAIIGSMRDDDNGSSSGSAYLFDVRTGEQLMKLLPDDGEAEDLFGTSVAIDGDTAIVGASRDGDLGHRSGSAYVFDTRTGEQLIKLLAGDGTTLDHFGNSVSISGNLAMVGAASDDNVTEDSGSAYLFDVASGRQAGKLLAYDGQMSDVFGWELDIDNDTAVIGAPGDDDLGRSSGSTFVFTVSPPCPPDLNGDGVLNILDFVTFQLSWAAGISAADFNGDDDFTMADYLEFRQRFDAGCE